MKTKLVLVGGGGHCESCIDVIESTELYEIVGILDSLEKVGQQICGYAIVGTDEDMDTYVKQGCSFLITVGQVKHAAVRSALLELLQEKKASLPSIVASTAYVSKHAKLMPGCIVMHRAVVNAGAVIGGNSIINTCAVVEHGATVGTCCHISTGAVINGACTVGDYTFIGSNATLNQGVTVAAHAVIGAGAVVVRSISESGIYVGNPIKKRV